MRVQEELASVDITPRWFEAATGDSIFYLIRESITWQVWLREYAFGGRRLSSLFLTATLYSSTSTCGGVYAIRKLLRNHWRIKRYAATPNTLGKDDKGYFQRYDLQFFTLGR